MKSVLKKDLLEIIRDKTTWILLFMTIISFPVMRIALKAISETSEMSASVAIVYDDHENYTFVKDFIEQTEEARIKIVDRNDTVTKTDFTIRICGNDISYIYNSTEFDSLTKASKFSELFSEYYINYQRSKGQKILSFAFADENNNVNSTDSLQGIFSPILIITIIFQASSLIANELFAGEKERKTLEMLILSGIDKGKLYFGKLTALFIFSAVNTMAGLISFVLAFKQSEVLSDFSQIIKLMLIILFLTVFSVTAGTTVSVISKNIKMSQMVNELVMIIPVGFSGLASYGIIDSSDALYKYVPCINLVKSLSDTLNNTASWLEVIFLCASTLLIVIIMFLFSRKIMKSDKFIR